MVICYNFSLVVQPRPICEMSNARGEHQAMKRKRGVPGADHEGGRRSIALGPLQHQIGYALRRAQLAVFADIIAALAEFDLSPAKFSVLTVIQENPGARSSDVGRALGIRKTNFVPLLDALEQRRLVVRQPSEQDRRALALYLTPKGQALLQQAASVQARHEARFVARIGESGCRQLLDLLERLADAPANSDAAPRTRMGK